MVSRRAFVMTSLATLALPRLAPGRSASWRSPAPAPAPRQFADVPLQSVKVRDNVFFITERGGNSMLIVTRNGPVLIDTKMPASGRLLLDESKKYADGSAPKFVINTHHHFDHTGGNAAFDDAAEMIAHRNLSPRMQAHLDERIKPAIAAEVNALRNSGKTRESDELAAWAAALAADDFKADRDYVDTLELDLGGVKIVLRHFRQRPHRQRHRRVPSRPQRARHRRPVLQQLARVYRSSSRRDHRGLAEQRAQDH